MALIKASLVLLAALVAALVAAPAASAGHWDEDVPVLEDDWTAPEQDSWEDERWTGEDDWADGGWEDEDVPAPVEEHDVTPAPASDADIPATIQVQDLPAVRSTPSQPQVSTKGVKAAKVPYGALIAATARKHGLPVAFFTALVWQESGFKARARSRVGARGLTQLMPATARSLGVRNSWDPAQNLDGGAKYLKTQLRRFGSRRLALAAYNAGPGAVSRYRGVPPYAETRNYVRNILRLEARLKKAGVRG